MKFCMFCDLYMCRNNLDILFNYWKGINNLTLTLLVPWNVGKYSDHILDWLESSDVIHTERSILHLYAQDGFPGTSVICGSQRCINPVPRLD